MRTVTTRAATLLVAILWLAACGGAAEPAATGAATNATAAAATATATATAPGATPGPTSGPSSGATAAGLTIAVAETDLGTVLADGDGMTLYVFDSDDVDTSACTGGCLDAWPPVLGDEVTAGEGVSADLGTFTRDDGDVQATVGGRPLYRYATDAAPGDTAGQGVGGLWWVVDPAGMAITEATDTGSAASYGDPAY